MQLARLGGLLFAVAWVVVAASFGAQQAPSPRPAVPTEPVAAILDAFQTHNIVAFGESHGDQQIHLFCLRLLRDPRFGCSSIGKKRQTKNAHKPVSQRGGQLSIYSV